MPIINLGKVPVPVHSLSALGIEFFFRLSISCQVVAHHDFNLE